MFLRNYITEFVKIISFLFTLADHSLTICMCCGSIYPNQFVRFCEMIFFREKIKTLVAWKLEA